MEQHARIREKKKIEVYDLEEAEEKKEEEVREATN